MLKVVKALVSVSWAPPSGEKSEPKLWLSVSCDVEVKIAESVGRGVLDW